MISLPLCLPDSITPEQFLTDYWQKKPLLIKQGLPQLIGMFEPDDMLGLALEEDASARLLTQAALKQDGHHNGNLKKARSLKQILITCLNNGQYWCRI